MKNTGISKKIDDLGRVVLPKEIRKTLGLIEGIDTMEIRIDGQDVILRKYEVGCVFCKGTKGLKDFKGKPVCENCRKE